MKQRIAITGLGMVSPIGNNIDTAWQNALLGKSGVRALQDFADFDGYDFRAKVAARIVDFEISPYMSAKDARRYDLFIQYGVAAAAQALKQANLINGLGAEPAMLDGDRAGVVFGSGIGGIDLIEKNALKLAQDGARMVSPFFVPASIINMVAGQIAIRHALKGANLATATACASSAHAIGLGARLIAYGDADVMVVGGCEFASTPLGIGGFSAMQALSSNPNPVSASCPFDSERDGFVLGDGAGALVLESFAHAKARGATILAELVGFGMSDDASHITAPPKDGAGARRAMLNALQDANLDPSAIDYINAHGTSTPVGDAAEAGAISSLFGNAPKVSSTKSMTGHLLGAAGAVEACFCIMSILAQKIPPTINLTNPDPACVLNHVAHHSINATVNYALSNSFGFGGTNASLIFGKV